MTLFPKTPNFMQAVFYFINNEVNSRGLGQLNFLGLLEFPFLLLDDVRIRIPFLIKLNQITFLSMNIVLLALLYELDISLSKKHP